MITINFDGACEFDPASGRRNPGGISTFGWVIKHNDHRLAYGYGEAGRSTSTVTNNLGEYTALIRALEAYLGLLKLPDCQALRDEPIRVYGDSQLVVKQVRGEWRVKNPALWDLREQVYKLAPPGLRECNEQAQIAWVPRERNEEADNFSKQAYHLALRMSLPVQPWEKRFRFQPV